MISNVCDPICISYLLRLKKTKAKNKIQLRSDAIPVRGRVYLQNLAFPFMFKFQQFQLTQKDPIKIKCSEDCWLFMEPSQDLPDYLMNEFSASSSVGKKLHNMISRVRRRNFLQRWVEKKLKVTWLSSLNLKLKSYQGTCFLHYAKRNLQSRTQFLRHQSEKKKL